MNGGPTDPGFTSVPVKGASAYPGVIITTCTSHLGTVERVTRLLFHSTTFVPVIHSLTERSSEGQPAHTASGDPSGENAAGAKRGRPAPGEHREERETGRWKSQGRPGHLTEMEGFSLFEKALWKGKCINSWKKRERAYIYIYK
ncbi:UNVERIFIED_CONTAM: hypothetical protein Scaly_3137200 [Sesamum calycinum]|uniref:Uncharacterized protein n=1 Tax=Sesamum calycinum TaxID=2727403 RepID=A0AAW2JGW9_9LAMI